jgi:hypothetical protein
VRIGEARVRAQLTRRGGTAEVRIRSFPATRLLSNAGQSIAVRGREVEIGLAEGAGDGKPAGLGALDGFSDVDIELVSFRAGPFAVSAFVLERTGGGTYALAARARASGGAIAELGSGRWPQVPGGRWLGAIPVPAAITQAEVPFSVEAELSSSPAGLRVLSGGGTIAGYPAGRVAAEIAAAVSRRLEIVA